MVNSRLSFLDKLNLFIDIYGQLFIGIFRISWWSPFLLYAAFQFLGFTALLWYYAPILSVTVYPLVSIFFPPNVFHYPQYYLALPSLYATYDTFILGITIWFVIVAAAVYRLSNVFAGKKSSFGDGIKNALRSYPSLLFIWILETILVIVILYLPNLLLKDIMAGSPNFAALVNIIFEMLGLLVTAMLIYSIPGIIIDGKNLSNAIGASIRLFFGNFFLTYFIVFIPSIIQIALNLLLSNFAPKIITMLNPDLIPIIMIINIIVGIFINLFIYGAAVYAYKRMAG